MDESSILYVFLSGKATPLGWRSKPGFGSVRILNTLPSATNPSSAVKDFDRTRFQRGPTKGKLLVTHFWLGPMCCVSKNKSVACWLGAGDECRLAFSGASPWKWLSLLRRSESARMRVLCEDRAPRRRVSPPGTLRDAPNMTVGRFSYLSEDAEVQWCPNLL